MKLRFLPVIPLLSTLFWSCGLFADSAAYRTVDLDRYIQSQQPLNAGTRTIIKPRAVSVRAELMAKPEVHKTEYAYTALSMMRVEPLPEIGHRMFIRSAAGKVIPVYITAAAAEKITDGLDVGEQALFHGLHIYNYRQGPAIVVEDFVKP